MVMHWSTALLYKTARALHLSSTGLQIAMHTWGELVVLCTILTTTFVTDGTKPVLCGTSICGQEASCNGICVCKKGYTGKILPRYPTPVVWCQKKCAGNEQICPLNTTCLTHTSGPASCECSQGFLMDTFGQCLDADECSDNPGICGNHSTCINTVGNYTCWCHEGYFDVDGTGSFCEKDENECTLNPGICGNNSVCIDTKGTHTCHCEDGYTRTDPDEPGCNREKDFDELVIWITAGFGAALIFATVVVFVGLIWRSRRSRRRKQDKSNRQNAHTNGNNAAIELGMSSLNRTNSLPLQRAEGSRYAGLTGDVGERDESSLEPGTKADVPLS